MTDREPRSAAVAVPCTCGELVQGVLDGEPFLVSCPIDRYSRVRVQLAVESPPAEAARYPKARSAASATLERVGRGGTPFSLEVSSPLAPSKGFGSSTADVVGAIVATAAAAGVVLSPPEVARLAVGVEPSDGTMFPGLALFNHRSGNRWESLGTAPPLLVVVLEFDGAVDTLDYNARLDLASLRSMEPEHGRALDLLREGLRRGRPELIGQAATASARINQRLLPKPELEAAIRLGHDCHALGVCAAHSGTALGVIFAPEAVQEAQELLERARTALAGLADAWISRLVDGGARPLPSAGDLIGVGQRMNPQEWGGLARSAPPRRPGHLDHEGHERNAKDAKELMGEGSC